jgi:type I restriction enzyme R subunit
MVVVSSRVEAVRWQVAINKYITDKRYPLRTLVAFSGEVDDKESGPGPFRETSPELNAGLKGRDVAKAFDTEEYQILLVANKYQTGFDQPLLCGMYVDKRLDGIQAVQTLSRLNRCHPGKEETFILDFVNDPDQVLAAFKTYYTTAQLSDVTDPQIILKLRSKLDGTGYYDEYEIDRVVAIELDPKAKPSQLGSAIKPVADRLLKKFTTAKEARNQALSSKQDGEAKAAKDVMDSLILFRTDMMTYLKAYTFLSQIFDYANTDFEKRAIFFRYLTRLLKFGREREGIDLSQITLTHHRLKRIDPRALPLSDKDAPKLKPVTEAGSGEVREKQTAYLSELIEKLNTIFGSDTTDGDQLSFINTLGEKTLESKRLQQQAASNTKEQFNASPDLTAEIIEAVMETMDVQQELSTRALNSTEVRDGVKHWLLNYFKLYEKLRDRAAKA